MAGLGSAGWGMACGGDAALAPDVSRGASQPAGSRTSDAGSAAQPSEPSPPPAAIQAETGTLDGGTDAGGFDCPPTRLETGSDVNPPPSTLAGAAVNVMLTYCGNCHTPGGAEGVAVGPANVADFNGMIDEGFVVDCSGELSPIITSMRQNEMPPPGYLIPVTAVDAEVVVQYIEFLCTDEERACAVRPSDSGCDDVLSARRRKRCAW